MKLKKAAECIVTSWAKAYLCLLIFTKTHKMYKIDSMLDGTYAVIHLVSKKSLLISHHEALMKSSLQSLVTVITWSPPVQAPLYSWGIFQLLYIQQ